MPFKSFVADTVIKVYAKSYLSHFKPPGATLSKTPGHFAGTTQLSQYSPLPLTQPPRFQELETEGPEEEYPLSKTVEMGRSVETSQIPGEIWYGAKGFTVLDNRYFIPFFRKRLAKVAKVGLVSR